MVIPRFASAALTGQPLEIYGDGTQTCQWIGVRIFSIAGCDEHVFDSPAVSRPETSKTSCKT